MYLHLDQDRKSKLDEVHSLIICGVECKVLSKIPKIVMLACPSLSSLGLRSGRYRCVRGGGAGVGAGVTAR